MMDLKEQVLNCEYVEKQLRQFREIIRRAEESPDVEIVLPREMTAFTMAFPREVGMLFGMAFHEAPRQTH